MPQSPRRTLLVLGVILWMANVGLSVHRVWRLNDYDSRPPALDVLTRGEVDRERIAIILPAIAFNPPLLILGPTWHDRPLSYWMAVGAGAALLPLLVIGCTTIVIWLKRHADAE